MFFVETDRVLGPNQCFVVFGTFKKHALCVFLLVEHTGCLQYTIFCFFFHCGSGGPAWISRTTRNSTLLGSSDANFFSSGSFFSAMALCWILEELLFKLGSSCWQLGKDGHELVEYVQFGWTGKYRIGTTLAGGSMWRLQVWHLNVYDTACRNVAQYRLHVLRDFEILVVFGWEFVGLEHGCWFWCSTVSQIAACCCESSARYMPSEKNAASAK